MRNLLSVDLSRKTNNAAVRQAMPDLHICRRVMYEELTESIRRENYCLLKSGILSVRNDHLNLRDEEPDRLHRLVALRGRIKMSKIRLSVLGLRSLTPPAAIAEAADR